MNVFRVYHKLSREYACNIQAKSFWEKEGYAKLAARMMYGQVTDYEIHKFKCHFESLTSMEELKNDARN